MAFPWESKFNNRLRLSGLRAHRIRPRPGVRFGFNLMLLDDDGDGPGAYLALAPGLRLGRFRPRRFSTGVWPQLWARVVLK